MTRFGIGFRSSVAARLARVVTLSGLVLLGATGAAHAGSWALVRYDGTLAKYKGVLANYKDGPGRYRIVFRRSIERCIPVATSNDGALLIVHETGPAGYPFSVVQGNLGERCDLVTPDRNMGRSSIEGGLALDATGELVAHGGQDFDAL